MNMLFFIIFFTSFSLGHALGNTLPIKWPVVFVWGLVGGVFAVVFVGMWGVKRRCCVCLWSVNILGVIGWGSFWGYWIFHFFSFCNKWTSLIINFFFSNCVGRCCWLCRGLWAVTGRWDISIRNNFRIYKFLILRICNKSMSSFMPPDGSGIYTK